MKVVAVIPIKLNNERLPGKNIKELNGRPLIHYVQENLLAEPRIDERYVFCSSEEISDFLLHGVMYLPRPRYLDSDTANFTEIFGAFMDMVPADIYVYAHATAPFIETATTAECLGKVLSGEYDSAFCAARIQDFLWQNGEPLNFDAAKLPRSQDLEPIYRETSGIYVFRKEVFQSLRRRIGDRPYVKEVSYREAIDINTPEDFALAETMAAHAGRRCAVMDKFNLLECTLRDGGYITDWHFPSETIKEMIQGFVEANMDVVEVGYLNRKPYEEGTTQFHSIEQIAEYLPRDRKNVLFLAMADVQQFLPEDLTPYTGKSIDGIRVVFYKHQVEQALLMCRAVKGAGYKLFVQPMVTIDYSMDEYTELAKQIAELEPDGVAIVDSFGYMIKEDFRRYFKVLDNLLPPECAVGFHSHNNMNLSFITGQDILEYTTTRHLIIDASLYGMGRGAGNLQTELIANYCNMTLGRKYDTLKLIDLISKYIMPIHEKKSWGYSPYYFLTGLYKCHPNYVSYLLQEHDVPVSEFKEYLDTIPKEMHTKCRKPYVLEMYDEFIGKIGGVLR